MASFENEGIHEPVHTMTDLDSLDEALIVEGHLSAERGDPEPGPNRGRSFWHGWPNRMMDLGAMEHDEAARTLAREFVAAAHKDGKRVKLEDQR
jgi:hypothetical protein